MNTSSLSWVIYFSLLAHKYFFCKTIISGIIRMHKLRKVIEAAALYKLHTCIDWVICSASLSVSVEYPYKEEEIKHVICTLLKCCMVFGDVRTMFIWFENVVTTGFDLGPVTIFCKWINCWLRPNSIGVKNAFGIVGTLIISWGDLYLQLPDRKWPVLEQSWNALLRAIDVSSGAKELQNYPE